MVGRFPFCSFLSRSIYSGLRNSSFIYKELLSQQLLLQPTVDELKLGLVAGHRLPQCYEESRFDSHEEMVEQIMSVFD